MPQKGFWGPLSPGEDPATALPPPPPWLGKAFPVAASQYLLFGDPHGVGDLREDCGFDEESAVFHGRAPAFQLGSLFLPALDEIEDFLELVLVNLQDMTRWTSWLPCGQGLPPYVANSLRQGPLSHP